MTESTLSKAQGIYRSYIVTRNTLYSLEKGVSAVLCDGKKLDLPEETAAEVQKLLIRRQKESMAKLWTDFEAL